jgi:hypothetical protein
MAAIEAVREQRSWGVRRLHRLHAEGCERLQRLEEIVSSLGARLMHMPDSPEADALTREYHELLDQSRRLELVLQSIERGMKP